MAEDKNAKLLKVSLLLLAVVTVVYGLIHLLIPELYVKMSGSDPIPSSWIRWFGGILFALGIGAIMVFRNPLKQGIFILMIAVGTLLCGLTLLYSLFFESAGIGKTWATATPAIVTLILSALFWISLKQAKAILWNEEK
jgi:uncharacterized protein YjeT (DUF2065 family)